MIHQLYETDLTIECSAGSGFRIMHNKLITDYQVINANDKIMILYNSKRESISFEEGQNVFAFRESYMEWALSVIEKIKEKKRAEDDNLNSNQSAA